MESLRPVYNCCCSITKSCPTPCDLIDCSISASSSLCLSEFVQFHVHCVSDAIQSSHLLLLPSPLVFNLFQHQGVFQWVSSCIRKPKYWSFSSVLPMNIRGWFPLGLTGLISLQSKRFLRVFSSTTIWKHHFATQPSLRSNIHISTWLMEKL